MQLSALAHYMGHNSHKTRALLEIDLTLAIERAEIDQFHYSNALSC